MLLLSKKQTIEEFNKDLAEGLELGAILVDAKDIDIIIQLYNNLSKFLLFESCQGLKV